MAWQDGVPTAAAPAAGPVDWTLGSRATAAAPIALEWAQKAQATVFADTLVSGIPNLALAAGAVWVYAQLRSRQRRSRRASSHDDDE